MSITQQKKEQLLHILEMKKILGVEHIHLPLFRSQNKMNNNLPNNGWGLQSYIDNCSLCRLSKTKEYSSLGVGNSNSSLLILGMNIDFKNENEFAILKDMVQNKLLLNTEDIYITNLLKCVGKKSLKEYSEEVKQCISYFEKQISFQKPKVIIAFGEAFKYIMNYNGNINEISGSVYRYEGVDVIPLVELSYTIKNPSYKEKMEQDLEKIKNILEKI